MANVKEILYRTPPSVLYHYTTQQGLLGIIRDQEIWASHTQYLNDVREFRHEIDLVREELLAMMKAQTKAQTPAREDVFKCLAEMQEALISGMEGINVCVCSFSERGDVLSQWRAYGGATSGFALGFSGASLRSMSEKQECWLAPVIYDEPEQREFVRTLLQDVLAENLMPTDTHQEKRPGGNILAYLDRYALILKHHSFAEECEWRIITRPLPCTDERFGYRPGGSMLIPYFRLPLAKEEKLGIKEIVIGPTPHPEQSRGSVRGLCLKHDIFELGEPFTGPLSIAIRCSESPYRSW